MGKEIWIFPPKKEKFGLGTNLIIEYFYTLELHFICTEKKITQIFLLNFLTQECISSIVLLCFLFQYGNLQHLVDLK